jgi:hypothetical protein
MAREIEKLEAADMEILAKIPAPPPRAQNQRRCGRRLNVPNGALVNAVNVFLAPPLERLNIAMAREDGLAQIVSQ